jgi:hypothetical protein
MPYSYINKDILDIRELDSGVSLYISLQGTLLYDTSICFAVFETI